MKETFITKKFGREALDLLENIHRILADYDSQGFTLSLRQLFYQLVTANIIANTERSYKNIGNLVSDARLAGMVDWDAIEDRGRNTIQNSHWFRPADIIDSAVRSFAIDKWLTQDNYIEVMVEKQALEGVLQPVCATLDIPFTSNKGYSSSSALYECGKRYESKLADGKTCHIIYLGDHDPSGIDMTRDVLERINLFANGIAEDSDVSVHRVALNIDQVRSLKPPENPAKLTDSRAGEYIRKFGRSSWELDAIRPDALAKLVTAAVIELRDEEEWDAAVAREKAMKDELRTMARNSKFK